jgi:hypothetical protein
LFVLGIGILLVFLLCAGVALALGFSDIQPGDDYSEAILDLSDWGIITGFEDGTFRPNDPVTRQQFAKMVVNALGLTVTGSEYCPFVDVANQVGTDPFYPSKYVAVCANNGITVGKTANTFDPYSNITRAQVMTMVVRAAPLAGVELTQPTSAYYSDPKYVMNGFSDPNHGLNAQMAELSGLLWGIRLDSAGYWEPYKKATRGEVAQILWRLIQKIPTTEVLAYDDFEDPSSGWAETFDNDFSANYLEGFYRVGATNPDVEVASWWPWQVFSDAYYEAWAWPDLERGSWEYGLVFRLQNLDNFYELSVFGNDTAQLYKRVGGEWTEMSPMVDLPPSSYAFMRHLEVMMLGNTFMAFVDGVPVGEFTDNTFATGYLGFYVRTFDEPNFAVFFDDFLVWPIVY